MLNPPKTPHLQLFDCQHTIATHFFMELVASICQLLSPVHDTHCIDMELQVPQSQLYRSAGSVVWCDPDIIHCACSFVIITGEDQLLAKSRTTFQVIG